MFLLVRADIVEEQNKILLQAPLKNGSPLEIEGPSCTFKRVYKGLGFWC